MRPSTVGGAGEEAAPAALHPAGPYAVGGGG